VLDKIPSWGFCFFVVWYNYVMRKNILVKGFTLIELLVVIAIIGILASVVLASLNTARDKGSDSAVKQNLSGMRAQAEVFYDDETKGNGTYGTAFAEGDCAATSGTLFEDPNIVMQYSAAAAASGAGVVASCVSTGDAWAVSVPMKSTPTNSWCVDSLGVSGEVTPASDRGFAGAACKPLI